ncbi:MAG: nucleotidyltransferase domain-containing protein [Planctomycetes bacterium]|nr:nucleotidyltransferase domain-containing protein [Planctomycetota bacterium]
MFERKPLSEDTLREIIRRIVEVAHPERIILFGSAARGEVGPNSDVDVLVVKSGQFDHSRLVGDIYMNMHGLGQAVDVVLATPEQIERYRNTHCLVIAPALRDGKEVYRDSTLLPGRSERVAEPSAQ